MPHLGLESWGPYLIYGGMYVFFFLSIFWRPDAGLYFIMPMLPLQTVRFRLHRFFLGAQVIDIVLLGVFIGLLMRRQLVLRTPLTKIIAVLALTTYIGLWIGFIRVGTPAPLWFDDIRTSNWKNYMIMPALFFLVVSAITTKKQMTLILVTMCLGTLLLNRSFRRNAIVGKDYSSFSYAVRESGAMGFAGINGLAAFEVQTFFLLLALGFSQSTLAFKIGYSAVAASCAYCAMYSLSRGAYAAFIVVFVYFALFRQRALLAIFILFMLTWQVIVPNAVRERIFMTYGSETEAGVNSGEEELDASSATRIELWQDALVLVKQYWTTGSGYNTYAFMGRVRSFRDTHNLYLKVLVEGGVIGLLIILALFLKMYWLSYKLYRSEPKASFLAAIGFGVSAYMLCVMIVNLFGDRWIYVQVSGYTWVAMGLVVRGQLLVTERGQTIGQGQLSRLPALQASHIQPAV